MSTRFVSSATRVVTRHLVHCRQPTLPLFVAHQRRGLATEPTVKDVPRPAPHDSVPFKAPPVDTTQGQLGQVFMPDMDAIEPIVESQTRIPADPDTFQEPTNRDDDFPFLHEPRVFTTSHPQTFPDAPSHGSKRDDVVIEQLNSEDEIHSSKVPKEQDVNSHYKYQYEDSPLSDQDKKGAIKLVGLLVAGWLLGGINETRRHKEKRPEIQVANA
ncbi:hypothetical protein OIO90_004126 [Microbotryomycetes sp. JL221]|nr:hypothetical protein OIO90_004126 [Microbotryomycetes sp. JL221]